MRILTLATALCAAVLAVTAALASADTGTFTSADGAITIADNQAASPYPSTITVSGLTGGIADLSIELTGFAHAFPGDVDILLRAPSGHTVMLMSDTCLGPQGPTTITIRDGAPASAVGGSCAGGTFRPTDLNPGDALPAPGGTPTGALLATLQGEDPNGAWQLFVADDAGGDVGSIAGWSLTVTTAAAQVSVPASGTTSGTASSYPLEIQAPAIGAGNVIQDLTVTLGSVYHTNPEDLDVLLEGPTGVSVPLVSDACGTAAVAVTLTLSDAAGTLLGTGPCLSGTYRPTDIAPGDVWPAPAPAPTAAALAAFSRTDPRGTWRVYIADDTAGGTGSMPAAVTLSITASPARPLFFFTESVPAVEGRAATLRLARLGAPSGAATVDYTAAAGSAAEGADFTATSGTVTFAAGELTKRIEVPILADGTEEGTEDLTVRLSNVRGDAVLDGSEEARIVIAASEGPAAPPATPAPTPPAAGPCDGVSGAARTACLRKRRAAKARAACIKRYRPGPRRTACLRTAARIAAVPAKR